MQSSFSKPTFIARIRPGTRTVLLPPDAMTEPTVPAEGFLSIGGPNAVAAVSDCGRYIAAIVGTYILPGEVAGYRSAAEWLIAKFPDNTDTCLKGIDGSWRLAFLDTKKDEYYFATDRMGAMRVCYSISSNGTLSVSSSAEEIGKFGDCQLSIDPTSILDYFFFSCIPSPSTLYSNVRALGPSQLLNFNGSVNTRRYWSPEFFDRAGRREMATPEELLDTLESSVASCVTDRPVAAFLSGGLDSSTVVGMAARSASQPVTAYSIGFDEKNYDETPYARIAASHFATPLSVYYVTPDDVMTTIDTVASNYDEPFGNSSAIPTYFCAHTAASAGETKILAGDGGDELYAGNERYKKQQIFSYYDLLGSSLKKRIIEPLLLQKLANVDFFPIRKARRYVEQALVPMPDRLQTYNFLMRDGLERIFTRDFLDAVNENSPLLHMHSVWNEADTDDLIDRMLYLDWKFTLADNDLRKVTTMCDAAGIEVSFPMLSNRLIELACNLSGSRKMRNGRLRGFYKHATRDFLPNEILRKPKHGFGLPFGPWFSKSRQLREHALELVNNHATRNIVRAEYIDQVREATMRDHPGYFGEMIWLILILESWLSARSQWHTFKI